MSVWSYCDLIRLCHECRQVERERAPLRLLVEVDGQSYLGGLQQEEAIVEQSQRHLLQYHSERVLTSEGEGSGVDVRVVRVGVEDAVAVVVGEEGRVGDVHAAQRDQLLAGRARNHRGGLRNVRLTLH